MPFDAAALEHLRARYGTARGGDIHDPHFRAVADRIFSGDRRKWPFADPATQTGSVRAAIASDRRNPATPAAKTP